MATLGLTLVILFLAVGGACWFLVHSRGRALAACGRWLCMSALTGLGLVGAVTAAYRPDQLTTLGLLPGLLVVALVWESPDVERGTRP